MRILLVEDDSLVSDAINRGLVGSGYVVDAVPDAESVAARLADSHYDLAIVDLGLPGEDGLTLVRKLRRSGSSLPLLIVTARDGLDDRINALDLGADDYLVKPFALPELAARRRALNAGGEVLELTRREWSILECLAHHSGRVVSKERLTQAITGWSEDISGNAIEVHVSRLRSKLGGSATVRGIRGLG